MISLNCLLDFIEEDNKSGMMQDNSGLNYGRVQIYSLERDQASTKSAYAYKETDDDSPVHVGDPLKTVEEEIRKLKTHITHSHKLAFSRSHTHLGKYNSESGFDSFKKPILGEDLSNDSAIVSKNLKLNPPPSEVA